MPVSKPVALRGTLSQWLVTGAAGAMFAALAVACSNGDNINPNGCTAGEQSSCSCPNGAPDGVQVCASDGLSFGECDCGGNNGNCGNSALDSGEECDDGNTVDDDGCTNSCKLPKCGDGIVQEGEVCDDAGAVGGELDTCASDCQGAGSGSGGGGTGGAGDGGAGGGALTCADVTMFAGIVAPNDTVVTTYLGASQWTYMGMIKQQAGDAMCNAKALGSHLCDYEELKLANTKADVDEPILTNIANTTTLWVNRTTAETVGGTVSQPGAGGRCNDWQYITNHVSDGEYATVGMSGALTFTLDGDTFYDGVDGTHTVAGDLQCGATTRAIPCCYPCTP